MLMKLMRRISLVLVLLGLTWGILAQEDGQDLPAELYILLNGGTVESYGVGVSGIHTVTPDDVYVVDFGVAPDNRWMAYRTEEGLSVMLLRTGAVSLIDSAADIPPIRGLGETIAWSPLGDAIAYTTPYGLRAAFDLDTPIFTDAITNPLAGLMWSPQGSYLAAYTEDHIWWIFRRDGSSLALASAIPTSYGATWLNDSNLVFAPPEGGLIAMDLAAANEQTTLYGADMFFRRPFVRADGSIVVFEETAAVAPIEEPDVESTEEPGNNLLESGDLGNYLRLINADGQWLPVENGEAPIGLERLRWSPDGGIAVAFRNGVLALVMPQSGAGFPLPIANVVAYSWGSAYAQAVTGLSSDEVAFFRAPFFQNDVVQVWRLPSDGTAAEPVTEVESDITAYAVTPRGDVLAYVSDSRLYTHNLGTGEVLDRGAVEPDSTGLVYSPDGQNLVFADAEGIWLLQESSEMPTLILSNSAPLIYDQPQYAPNVNALLLRVQTDDATRFAVFDPVSAEVLEIGAYTDAQWMVDGRLLAWRSAAGITQLMIVDPSTTPAIEIPLTTITGEDVVAARVTAPAILRLVLRMTSQQGPERMRLVELPISGGDVQPVVDIGYMVQPLLAANGTRVGGITRMDGQVTIYLVAEGRQIVLQNPIGVNDFRWLTFR